MSIVEEVNKSLRLCILRLLADPDLSYRANVATIHIAIGPLGFDVSRGRVEAQVDYLRDIGLVNVETVGNVRVVIVNKRGIAAAEGQSTVTGVARPSAVD